MKSLVFFLFLSLLSSRALALVVLQYHHISDKAPPETSTSPKLFAAHLDYLEKNQFNVISILELEKLLLSKKGLPNNTVVITFDDGYRSVYTEAYPLLKKRKWPFTVFINTKPHDEKNPSYIQWEELREMAKHGATIANHSDSHPHLIRRKSGESAGQMRQRLAAEVDFSQQRIDKMIGTKHRFFAYPYGEYDEGLRKLLKEKGYLAFGQQSGPIASFSHRQSLPRFPLGGIYGNLEEFEVKVNSVPFPPLRIKITDDQGRGFTGPELPQGVNPPTLRLISPAMQYLSGLSCFGSGQGRIDANFKGGVLVVRALRPLPPGRSRYNCTANAGGGRHFWYSEMFIRRNNDGSWYRE